MLGTGERLRVDTWWDRTALLVSQRLRLLWMEARFGSPLLAAVGLVTMAMAVQTWVLNAPGHFRPAADPIFAVAVSAGTLLSLGLTLLSAFPLRGVLSLRVRQAVAISGLAALIVLTVLGVHSASQGVTSIVQGRPYTNDGAVFDLYAAHQVAHGHNPYKKTNIVAALAAINAPAITTTPLEGGQFRGARAYPSPAAVQQVFMNDLRYRPHAIPPEFESKYNYPAGSFLFILPLVWAGVHDMRFLYALAFILMAAYLWWRMPRNLRPVVPFLAVGDVPVVSLTAGGQPDPLYALFLMVGYAEWTTPWLSPLAMGIAVATKQLAWFFLPLYLILIVRRYGWIEALRRVGLMAVVFGLMNGVFILWSPWAYLNSIAAPMVDPMFPLGVGVIALFVSNILPMLPKVVFTLAELTSWAAGIVGAARLSALPVASGFVLGALPLFFAWRSLTNYFYLVPIMALAVILSEAHQRSLRRS